MPDAATARGSAHLATSFDLRAAEYARLRPEYPGTAVDAALPSSAATVLDVAAGTGKLTGSLLARGHRVVAVEPLAGMLDQLHRLLPAALAVAGTAEHLPVADGAVGAVTVGQAFHWFDQAAALDEMVRVLRPGGTVALLWNHDDERDPLVRDVEAALDRIGRPTGGSTGLGATGREAGGPGAGGRGATGQEVSERNGDDDAGRGGVAGHTAAANGTGGRPPRRAPFTDHRSLTDPVLTEVTWQRRLSVDDFIALQHTYSYVIRASDDVRAALDGELRAIIREHRGDADTVTVPLTCQVWRSVRR